MMNKKDLFIRGWEKVMYLCEIRRVHTPAEGEKCRALG